MNISNVTEPYHYYDYYTQPTDDLVTFNFSVTPTATLTPVTFDSGDAPDNLGTLSTPTQGEPKIAVMGKSQIESHTQTPHLSRKVFK